MSTLVPDDPRASDARCTKDELVVYLEDGRTLHVPIEWFPWLAKAKAADRKAVSLIGNGGTLLWPKLDEALLVSRLLARPCIPCEWRKARSASP